MAGDVSPLGVFFAAFAASSTAGIAAFLRSGKSVTKLALITAGLNSGLLGLAIALLWFQKFQDNIYFLVGICVITGLTGAAGLDFILSAIQNGGFSVNIGGGKDKDGNNKMDFEIKDRSDPKDSEVKK